MKLVATRILPILVGLASLNFTVRLMLAFTSDDPTQSYGIGGAFFLFFAVMFITVFVGQRWHKRANRHEASDPHHGSVTGASSHVPHHASFHDSGPSDSGFGGGSGGGGGAGGSE